MLKHLQIQNYRAFQTLELKDLAPVTLISGRNNVGKSSLLEAIRILLSFADPAILNQVLAGREELPSKQPNGAGNLSEVYFPLSGFFSSFPEYSQKLSPMRISSTGENYSASISFEPTILTEGNPLNGGKQAGASQATGDSLGLEIPSLRIEACGKGHILSLTDISDLIEKARSHRFEPQEQTRLSCCAIDQGTGTRTSHFSAMWDQVVLLDLEQEILSALRIIEPGISKMMMIDDPSPRSGRKAMVKVQGFRKPVPLRTLGEGVNRLFGILLSLAQAKGGVTLIDEFESGVHHSIQSDIWKSVFRMASRMETQIFATTHSWDTIEAFQTAALEQPKDSAALFRLSRRKNQIISTRFSVDELAVITRDRIEVR